MKLPSSPPESARLVVISDGYQICHRCGQPLVNGDRALVVFRSPDWPVYTHPYVCAKQAARDWSAIKKAEGIAAAPNRDVPERISYAWNNGRTGNGLLGTKHRNYRRQCITARPCEMEAHPLQIGGVHLPSRSLMDARHRQAELNLVDYSWQEETTITTKLGGLADQLTAFLPADDAVGRRNAIERVHYAGTESDSINYAHRPSIRNFVERQAERLADTRVMQPFLTILRAIDLQERTYMVCHADIPDIRFDYCYAPRMLRKTNTRRLKMTEVQTRPLRKVSLAEALELQRRGACILWRPEPNLPEEEQYAVVVVEADELAFRAAAD